MKKLALIVLLVVGLSTYAQEQKDSKKEPKREQLTPEQKNKLRLKKLTLDLNLNATQQKEMGKLMAEESARIEKMKAERKAIAEQGTTLTANQRYEKQDQKLDAEIALKEKVAKILTEEQLKKWEAMKNERREEIKERLEKREHKNSGKE